MRHKPLLRKLIRHTKRLPNHRLLQLDPHTRTPRQCRPDALQRLAEAALAQPRQVVLSRPDEVRVAKEEGRLAVLLVAAVREVGAVVHGREGPEDAAVRQQHVGQDLDVQAPVARVVVHEHGVDFEGAGRVAGADGVGERAREGRVVGQKLLREGPGLRMGG